MADMMAASKAYLLVVLMVAWTVRSKAGLRAQCWAAPMAVSLVHLMEWWRAALSA